MAIWRDRVSRLFGDAKFQPPATTMQLRRIESGLGITLPDDLRGLLLESNGGAANYSSPLVWSTDEIVRQNLEFRQNTDFAELYMPFDALFFFRRRRRR